MPIRASSADRSDGSLSIAALPQRQRAVGVAERLGELGGLAEQRARARRRWPRAAPGARARRAARSAGRSARTAPASRRATPSCSCSAAPSDRGRLDEQLDRASVSLQALERACARPRRAARPCASDPARPAPRPATPVGVAIVVAAALGELAQLLLGDGRLRRAARAAPRSDPSRPADRRARRAARLLPRGARWLSAGSSAITCSRTRITSRGRCVASKCERSRSSAASRIAGLACGRLDDALEQRERSLSSSASASSGLRRGERVRGVVEVVEPARRDARAALLAILLRLASRGGPPTARSDRPSARGARASARGRG